MNTLREVKKKPAPHPPAAGWQGQDLNPGLSDPDNQTFNHTSTLILPAP